MLSPLLSNSKPEFYYYISSRSTRGPLKSRRDIYILLIKLNKPA